VLRSFAVNGAACDPSVPKMNASVTVAIEARVREVMVVLRIRGL
jgi:hypothetical protein